MSHRTGVFDESTERELVVTYLLNARREIVYEAWINPMHVAQWWGPDGFTSTIHQMNVKPGGIWTFTMHGPDGTDYSNKIVFIEMARPEYLAYIHGDDTGNGSGQFEVTVTFDEQDQKTNLTMRMLFRSAEEREKMVKEFAAMEGVNQTITRLKQYLVTMTDYYWPGTNFGTKKK